MHTCIAGKLGRVYFAKGQKEREADLISSLEVSKRRQAQAVGMFGLMTSLRSSELFSCKKVVFLYLFAT